MILSKLLIPKIEAGVDLKTSLISCYEFEETSGTTCYDSHGSNDLQISGPTLASNAGKLGYSYSFDGSNDQVGNYVANALSPQAAHSISVWFKRNGNTTGGGSPTVGSLVSRYYGTTGNRIYYTCLWDSDAGTANRLTFNYYDTSNAATTINYDPGSNIWTGNWMHAVFVRNGSNMYMYVNNSLVASGSGGNGSMRQSTNGGVVDTIGCLARSNSIPDFFFNGDITQVGVWSIALSTDQISALYNSGNGLAYSAWN